MHYETFGIEDVKIYDPLTYSGEVTAIDFTEHYTNYCKSSQRLTVLSVQVTNKILETPESLYDVDFELPSDIQDVTSFPTDSTQENHSEVTGTYAMARAYTEIHQDCHIIPTFVLHIHGAKICFCG